MHRWSPLALCWWSWLHRSSRADDRPSASPPKRSAIGPHDKHRSGAVLELKQHAWQVRQSNRTTLHIVETRLHRRDNRCSRVRLDLAAQTLMRQANTKEHNMDIANAKVIDTNHAHPDAVVTTVQITKPFTWTVIGTPNGPDLVIDPSGTIHIIEWDTNLDNDDDALTIYKFVNENCF